MKVYNAMKRGIGMEDIIKQIVQIDSVALNTKKLNEENLKLKREQYEKEKVIIGMKSLQELTKEQTSCTSKLLVRVPNNTIWKKRSVRR